MPRAPQGVAALAQRMSLILSRIGCVVLRAAASHPKPQSHALFAQLRTFATPASARLPSVSPSSSLEAVLVPAPPRAAAPASAARAKPAPAPSPAAERAAAAPAAPIVDTKAAPAAPAAPKTAKAKGARGAGAAPGAHLPLVLSDKLARAKVLVELEGDGDVVDLDGDAGAVGRFYALPPDDPACAGGTASELRLDLKGVVYEARMVPSATCLVVRLEGGEAKVEAVMNEFMALRPQAAAADDSGGADGFAFGDGSERSGSRSSGGARGGGSDGDSDDSGGPGGKKSKGAKGAKGAAKGKSKAKPAAKGKAKAGAKAGAKRKKPEKA
jgi:hypothetical protein